MGKVGWKIYFFLTPTLFLKNTSLYKKSYPSDKIIAMMKLIKYIGSLFIMMALLVFVSANED
jgi:hypothetical protein